MGLIERLPVRLVDRQAELAFLNGLLKANRPTPAHFVLMYGRRRVGKTVLARLWARSTDLPTTYWAAEQETAGLQRRKLFARLLGVSMDQAPLFNSWADLWTTFAAQLAHPKRILILDEIPYAVDADSAFLSALQHAWDQQLRFANLILLLSGSHVRTMETLLEAGSPLYGRFTAQWHLAPLPFQAIREFVPKWSVEERVAAYAIIGGVPAYLEQMDPDESLMDNIEHVLLKPGAMFIGEPAILLADELREPRVFLSILKTIASGAHTFEAIGDQIMIAKHHLTGYLGRLQELYLIERRVPALVPPSVRPRSRMGRYHLVDPFLRFYFRFISPQQDELPLEPQKLVTAISGQLRAYVGSTAFEELCRLWVKSAHELGKLPFDPNYVTSHWSRLVQVDAVGMDWQTRSILLGECKWGLDSLDRAVVRELVEEKTPKVVRELPEGGHGWTVSHALFARRGFTVATRSYARDHGVRLVSVDELDLDLTQ